MKAKVFIGSSVEGLNIAYGIQQNLEYDCNPTVWTQGIFQLSSITLDDLLKALENSDFGVFVFNPDDVTKIRNHTFETVRDNIIFEFGLFIGRLGKEKVFFVFPKSENNLHLPTDLLGITPGTYDNTRDDKNIIAALGPFCNQVRSQLKEFVYQNLNDLKDETLTVKKIAMEKPRYWEFLLAIELLEPKLKSIKGSYEEIEKGLVFNKTTYLRTYEEFSNWFHGALKDLQKLISMFVPIIADELGKSFGPPGLQEMC